MSLREKLLQRLQGIDAGPKRSLGQNFLVSENVIQKILQASSADQYDGVIEVGPGLGALTDGLITMAKKLTLIELDQKICGYWRDERQQTVIESDALLVDWAQLIGEQNIVLVSNLPYQISSRLMVDLSLQPSKPQKMVLMFQKEVAQRILAAPGDSETSLLSMVAQTFWNLQLLLEAGSVDFHPKPRVASRVVVFEAKTVDPRLLTTEFLDFLKVLFHQKKKKVIRRLQAQYGEQKIKDLFAHLGIDEGERVHRLSSHQMIQMFFSL